MNTKENTGTIAPKTLRKAAGAALMTLSMILMMSFAPDDSPNWAEVTLANAALMFATGWAGYTLLNPKTSRP